jgi:hypothetical protein
MSHVTRIPIWRDKLADHSFKVECALEFHLNGASQPTAKQSLDGYLTLFSVNQILMGIDQVSFSN